MKKTLTIISPQVMLLLLLFSCSLNKERYNKELAAAMHLSVDYIDNRMPSTEPSKETRYLLFSVTSSDGELEHNWKTIHLVAKSEAGNVEAFKFDINDFKGKDKPIYRNALRIGLMDLSEIIDDITVTLESESGEKVKLSKTGVELQVVH